MKSIQFTYSQKSQEVFFYSKKLFSFIKVGKTIIFDLDETLIHTRKDGEKFNKCDVVLNMDVPDGGIFTVFPFTIKYLTHFIGRGKRKTLYLRNPQSPKETKLRDNPLHCI